MSTVESTAGVSVGPESAADATAEPADVYRRSYWQRLEALLERAGDELNPILVKEARQALKSRQFVITFSLLLACAWGWSLLGVALLSPGVRYAPGGGFMLSGYFVVLTVPMLLIVPFSAFRSIAGEGEDGTFELLSITAMSSWQIVVGKLGSAVIQMLVYYSALAPCIAFTYLLRGVDVVTIGFLLVNTFVASVSLSTLGLVLGTTSRRRYSQVVLSVLLLILLLLATVFWSMGFLGMISSGQVPGFDNADFWMGQLAVISMSASYAVLFTLVAAAQINFLADNRSTRIRVALIAQQFLWIGWTTFFWLRWEADWWLYIAVSVAGIHWAVIGAMLSGESGQLTERVKRSLPHSFLGRMAWTWFNPGPATGYVFAATNLFAFVVTVMCVVATTVVGPGGTPRLSGNWFVFAILISTYTTIYLGAGRWLILGLQKFSNVTMLGAFLVQVFLALAGIGLPIFAVAKWHGYGRLEYTSAQISNWIWTLNKAADGNFFLADLVIVVLAATAGIVFLANLWLAANQTRHVRQSTPSRVIEDESQRHPPRDVQPAEPRSPWDDV